jgi:hypothetical protein
MTKLTEPAPSQTRTSQSDPKRREMRRSHASEPKSGHLAQLATLINDSPRVQALKAMSGWMNPANAPPAQLAASPTQAPREGGLSNGLGAREGNLSEHSSANVVQRNPGEWFQLFRNARILARHSRRSRRRIASPLRERGGSPRSS